MDNFDDLYMTNEKFEMLNRMNQLENSIENIIVNADLLGVDDYIDLFVGTIPKKNIYFFIAELKRKYPSYYYAIKKGIYDVDKFTSNKISV